MTSFTIKTRSEAAYAIVYVGTKGGKPTDPTIEGYAHTKLAADKRSRRMGRKHVVLPIVDGTVTVDITPARSLGEIIAENYARKTAR